MIRSASPDAPALPKLAVGTVAALVAAKLLFHLAAIAQYGYFRDELYYLASTEHLAWGYVEHPPFSIALLALVRSLLGDSLPALRLVPVLAGAAVVLLTAILARRLGGGRFAQGIAALAAAMAPAFLGTGRYYSMNALDLLFWTAASLATLQALERGRRRDWAALGVLLGLGLLNKISMGWFGGGLAIGLIATRQRRALVGAGPWLAAAIALALFAPHVLWQVQNGWPTVEFIRNATSLKMAATTPGDFLRDQILTMNPGTAPLWIAGLVYGLIALRGRPGQVFSWIYLSVLVLLLAQGHSRASYLVVAYPPLLALGGVAVERFTGAARRWVRPALAALIVVMGLVAVPLALPVLPVRTFVRYQSALGMAPRTEERNAMGALPQDYADMFGWEEMAALVAKAYGRLTPAERGRCLIFGQNYGEAGAIDVIGRKRGLPPAISGHNSYWLWGPRRREWDVVIIIGGDRQDNAAFFDRVEIVGQTRSEWAMPYERGLNVSIARGPRMPLAQAWPLVKQYI
jgi:hypothetical protein